MRNLIGMKESMERLSATSKSSIEWFSVDKQENVVCMKKYRLTFLLFCYELTVIGDEGRVIVQVYSCCTFILVVVVSLGFVHPLRS